MAGIAWGFYQDYASFFRNNHGIMKLVAPSNFMGAVLSKMRMAWRARIPYTRLDVNARQLPPAPGAKRRVAVIIVGETARAQNWGLNGYARQTTPRLVTPSTTAFAPPTWAGRTSLSTRACTALLTSRWNAIPTCVPPH